MKLGLMPLLAIAAFSGSASASECGRVTIADMTWNSATLIANIDKFILENGYGCDAELIASDSVPAMTSMESKGQPDIAPEMWTNAFKERIAKGVEAKQLRLAGRSLVDGGEEGFWIPEYMVEKYPELKTIEGIRQHPELFPDSEDPDKAAFYSCPAGWNCQISSNNLFKALKLDEAGFHIIDPGSSAGLSGSIAKAYNSGEGWFGYYWAPTAILGKYNMVKVDFGVEVDKDQFTNCITQTDCTDLKPTPFPAAPVYTLATEKFAQKSPEIMEYLNKRGFTNAKMNSLLAWMEDNQADGEMAMYHFLENNKEMWQKWVSADAVEKIEEAL